MMHEILFRGKRKGNEEWEQEWIFGDLMQIPTHNFCSIIEQTACAEHCEVIPETVGQYTGLCDKNGTRIFEGDILSERPPMNQTAYIGYVAYDHKSAVWRFMIKNDTRYNGVLLGSYSNSYKIIGNIHDNPELLK